MHRCYGCGLIIGSILLDKDHYDNHCPKCDTFVDPKFVPTTAQMRDLGKRIAASLSSTSVPARPLAADDAETVSEYARKGKRTIRVGQQVVCQPQERKGTRRIPGEVVTIYTDGTTMIDIGEGVTNRVHADWVHVPNQPKEA